MHTYHNVLTAGRPILIGVLAVFIIVMLVVGIALLSDNIGRMKYDRKVEKLKILADDDNFFTDLLKEMKENPASFFFGKDWEKGKGRLPAVVSAHIYSATKAKHKYDPSKETYYRPGYLGEV